VLAKRSAATALVIALLALPGVALADSAGDNQYQDPFSNVPTQPKKKSSGSQGNTQTAPTQTPAASTTPSSTPVPGSANDPIAHAAGDSLPRTGFPVLPVAALGAALVAAGLVLRRLV
jgi:hypothetical protein